MKKTIKIFALGLLSAALFGCQDAALPAIENLVYITDAAYGKTGVVNFADPGQDTQVNFTVRLAQAVDEDVKVKVMVDPTILDQYNAATQSEFIHVPDSLLTCPYYAIIPAGSVSSDPITITVKEFPVYAQYAISFKIESKNAAVQIAEQSSQFIIQLKKPLKQMVPTFNRACAMYCQPDENWGLQLMNYTLEWWVKMSSLNINNQAIINSGGGTDSNHTELYIRFGDLVYSSGGAYDNRFLQVKTMGSQFDTGNPTVEGNELKAGQWYHFAISYDGATGKSILYKDGKMVAELATGEGRAMNIDRFQMCSSNSYFPNQAEMLQVRLWKTTRSQAQIEKNMRAEVDPNSEDLIMYLPMNEGVGATQLIDATGNGHDCNIGGLTNSGGNGIGTQAVTWTEYVF